MLIILALLTALYAVINALGAWAVIRRKPWVAGLFMLASALLVVATAGFILAVPLDRLILALGLVLASLASFFYARVVIGKVRWSHHAVRALLALGLFGLAWLVL